MIGWAVHLGIVGTIVAIEIVLYVAARRTANKDWQPALGRLEERFGTDLALRARQGRGPDWSHYRQEAERLFEPTDDRLRTLATAALAGGLGGTILTIIVHLAASWLLAEGTDPANLLWGMGVALIGSLVGVINNLLISLVLLPRVMSAFETAVSDLDNRLEEKAADNPARDLLSQAVREELQQLRTTLNSGINAGLTAAMADFPLVVTNLSDRVEALGQIVEHHAGGGTEAAAAMQNAATRVASATETLTPAVKSLGDASQDLVVLPIKLANALAEERERWLAGFREEQGVLRERLEHAIEELGQHTAERERELISATRDVLDSLAEVPQGLGKEIRQMSQVLGTEFGREARHLVHDLTIRLERERATIFERIATSEQEQRNNVGIAVSEAVRQLAKETGEHLTAPLTETAVRLGEEGRALQESVVRLEDQQASWQAASERLLDSWREAADRLESGSARLATSEGKLSSAGESLTAAAAAIERVASFSASFQADLQKALGEVTERHLQSFSPIRDELEQMTRLLVDGGSRINSLLEAQSQLIRDMVGEIIAGWPPADVQREVS